MTAPTVFTPPGGIIDDNADFTWSYTMDAGTRVVTFSIVYKPGSAGFNQQALSTRLQAAITDCNTAEGLINANGWDGLTPAQRKAIMLGVVQDIRAAARLVSSRLDASS